MRKVKINLPLLLLTACFIILNACQKDENDLSFNEEFLQNDGLQNMTTLQNVRNEKECKERLAFAKTLSENLSSRGIIESIISETGRKENGDYEFLYTLSNDTRLSYIFKARRSDFNNSYSLHESAIQEDPLLTIYLWLPKDMDRASVGKITKVYCSCDVDDQDKEAVIKYYEDGIYHETKAVEEPNEGVIVIKTNERIRIGEESNIKEKYEYTGIRKIGEQNGKGLFLIGDFPNEEESKILTDPLLKSMACQRDIYKNREGMQRLLWSENKEGWFMGGPEISVRVVYWSGSNSISGFGIYNFYNSDKGKWMLINQDFLTWYRTVYGENMKYHLSEIDGSSTQNKFTVSFTVAVKDNNGNTTITPGVSLSFGDNADDPYGETFVDYCDWVSPSTWGTLYAFGSGAQGWINVF